MSITQPLKCESISDLLDHADQALSGESFSTLVHQALRLTAHAVWCDHCFVLMRQRLHEWLDEPPAAVAFGHVAEAFIEFAWRATIDNEVWYPVGKDVCPDPAEWFCEDEALMRRIEQTALDPVPGRSRPPAAAASALLAQWALNTPDLEVWNV